MDTSLGILLAALASGAVLGMFVRVQTLLLIGLGLFVAAVVGLLSSPAFGTEATWFFGLLAMMIPWVWGAVVVGAIPGTLRRDRGSRRKKPRGDRDAAAAQIREAWSDWPHKSPTPTLAEMRAFYDRLAATRGHVLGLGTTRLGWFDVQEIVEATSSPARAVDAADKSER